jgi:2-polyprenyl-3-methyl-5-hydroxy-6-metoxy-1,4-benzoquinol methylase
MYYTAIQAIFVKEPILEKILRRMRLNQVLPYLRLYPECELLDIGCGWDARLLKTVKPYIKQGKGIDFKAPLIHEDNIQTFSVKLDKELPFQDQSFDFITMLAVLEHIENDLDILKECARLLRPGGGLLITVPSWYAKPILEFLAYRLHVVNANEIRDHKRYYNRLDIEKLVKNVSPLTCVEHRYFQFGCNNRVFVRKNALDTN